MAETILTPLVVVTILMTWTERRKRFWRPSTRPRVLRGHSPPRLASITHYSSVFAAVNAAQLGR